MKFLNLDVNNKSDERFFYRLVEQGYIKNHGKDGYYLGEVLQGYLLACFDKEYLTRDFLSALTNDEKEKEKIYEIGKHCNNWILI